MTDDNGSKIEHDLWVEEIKRRDAERAHDANRDYFNRLIEHTVQSGTNTVRMATTINGGAAVAVLAFMANTFATKTDVQACDLSIYSEPLFAYSLGVILSVFAIGFSYFTNLTIANSVSSMETHWQYPFVRPTKQTENYKWRGRWLGRITTLCVVASIGCFVLGTYSTYTALISSLRNTSC